MNNSKWLVSECDGGLYDTTRDNWHKLPALRPVFKRHFLNITNTQELKATIRAGEFTFPGGYRLAFVTEDGAVLSFQAVKEELHSVAWDIRNDTNSGWKVCGLINVDECDDIISCDHLGFSLNSWEL